MTTLEATLKLHVANVQRAQAIRTRDRDAAGRLAIAAYDWCVANESELGAYGWRETAAYVRRAACNAIQNVRT